MEIKKQAPITDTESEKIAPEKMAEKFANEITTDCELFKVTSRELQEDPKAAALTELINKQLMEASVIREKAMEELDRWKLAA